jgi:hypothetical protein
MGRDPGCRRHRSYLDRRAAVVQATASRPETEARRTA